MTMHGERGCSHFSVRGGCSPPDFVVPLEGDGIEEAPVVNVEQRRTYCKHKPTAPEIKFIGCAVRKYIRCKRTKPTGKYFRILLAVGKQKGALSDAFGYWQLATIANEANRLHMLKLFTKSRAKQAPITLSNWNTIVCRTHQRCISCKGEATHHITQESSKARNEIT